MPSRETLVQPVRALCHSLSSAAAIPDILRHFTVSPPPVAAEYGLKSLAPFLGREFEGQNGVAHYFHLVTDILAVHSMTFEEEISWMVDETLHLVGLRGKASFVWKDTGQLFEEAFFYRIGLAQEEENDDLQQRQWKVQDYRVWSDTGAAYLAHLNELGNLAMER
ncbi:hypothetical protein VI817_007887 [Penicillium citrinum]|nr:hypothetical protein VI817_007887 [Penicillium citrinum]